MDPVKIKVGTCFEFEGDLFFVSKIQKNRTEVGSDLHICLEDESIRAENAMNRMYAQTQREMARSQLEFLKKNHENLTKAISEEAEGLEG